MGALARFTAHRPEGSAAGGTWFNLGDQDLATHLYRTGRLAEGATLSAVTAEITAAFGLGLRLLPMTDDTVGTIVTVPGEGEITFQEYFVGRHHDVPISAVRFAGAATAPLGPGVADALRSAEVVVIAPSNPIVSIGPIRALAGMDDALAGRRDTVVAVSPIVAGTALKGPADRMLAELGHEASVVGVARLYAPICGCLVIDRVRRGSRRRGRAGGAAVRRRRHDHALTRHRRRARPHDAGGGAAMSRLEVWGVEGIGEIRPGDQLGEIIADACADPPNGPLQDGDVLVVTQKVVSKAEGRLVEIDANDPLSHKQLVEDEAARVVRRRGDLLITETKHGFICANSGVDLSNVERGYAALLPIDSDRSARRVRDIVRARLGCTVGVIVSDTFGRPWRKGLTDVAIGVAGIAGVVDLRGAPDALGRVMQVTEVAVADEIAGAAELVMGKSSGVPVGVVRGVDRSWLRDASVAELIRPPQEDLFR